MGLLPQEENDEREHETQADCQGQGNDCHGGKGWREEKRGGLKTALQTPPLGRARRRGGASGKGAGPVAEPLLRAVPNLHVVPGRTPAFYPEEIGFLLDIGLGGRGGVKSVWAIQW